MHNRCQRSDYQPVYATSRKKLCIETACTIFVNIPAISQSMQKPWLVHVLNKLSNQQAPPRLPSQVAIINVTFPHKAPRLPRELLPPHRSHWRGEDVNILGSKTVPRRARLTQLICFTAQEHRGRRGTTGKRKQNQAGREHNPISKPPPRRQFNLILLY